MKEDRYNSISFCPDNYLEYNDYLSKDCVDYDSLYKDVSEFIRIAITNGYQLKLWSDGYTVCVEYNYNDPGMSGVMLEWISDDEYIVKESERCDVESDTEPG